jgi:hypothetical protein
MLYFGAGFCQGITKISSNKFSPVESLKRRDKIGLTKKKFWDI